MKVNILLSAIGDYIPKYHHNDRPYQALVDEITQAAQEEWNARQPGEESVRFLQKMPTQYGLYFRFFEVTQQNENTLLVSTGRT